MEDIDGINQNRNKTVGTPNKVSDTIAGFFMGIAYFIVSMIILNMNHFYKINSFLIGLLIVIYSSIIIYFIIKKRSFISIGLVLTVVLPIAVVGGCILIVNPKF